MTLARPRRSWLVIPPAGERGETRLVTIELVTRRARPRWRSSVGAAAVDPTRPPPAPGGTSSPDIGGCWPNHGHLERSAVEVGSAVRVDVAEPSDTLVIRIGESTAGSEHRGFR